MSVCSTLQIYDVCYMYTCGLELRNVGQLCHFAETMPHPSAADV